MGKTKAQTGELVTLYGTYNVGENYAPSDGSAYQVVIIDVLTYKDQEDIVIKGPNGTSRRIDWFKFNAKYKKVAT